MANWWRDKGVWPEVNSYHYHQIPEWQPFNEREFNMHMSQIRLPSKFDAFSDLELAYLDRGLKLAGGTSKWEETVRSKLKHDLERVLVEREKNGSR